jgi:hypothetical protein
MIVTVSYSPPTSHLYPFRKRVEIFGALYAGGFGFWMMMTLMANQQSPVAWVTRSHGYEMAIAQFLIIGAAVHALGIQINGKWRGSPMLRAIGMSACASVFALFGAYGGGTSATYTYGWVTIFLLAGVWSAGSDFYEVRKNGR